MVLCIILWTEKVILWGRKGMEMNWKSLPFHSKWRYLKKAGWTANVKYASVRSKDEKKARGVTSGSVLRRVSILKWDTWMISLKSERSRISLNDPLDLRLRKILLTNSPGWWLHSVIASFLSSSAISWSVASSSSVLNLSGLGTNFWCGISVMLSWRPCTIDKT